MPNETVLKFAKRYLLQAQILYNAGSLNDFGACIAMRNAVKLFKKLAFMINNVIQGN